MILKEVRVEALRLTRGGCGRVRTVDAAVRHVTDGHGGLRCNDPTGREAAPRLARGGPSQAR